jgi:hypothetical protein
MRRKVLKTYSKLSTVESANAVKEWLARTGAEYAAVDADGVGGGVFDMLDFDKEAVVEMHGGMRSRDPEKYANRRAEWYWILREDFEKDEVALDPDDEELTGQLLGIKWKPDPKRRILIMSKEDMRRVGMKSPDRADAVVYAGGALFIDWDVVYGIHRCECGEGFTCNESTGPRNCPKCGRRAEPAKTAEAAQAPA